MIDVSFYMKIAPAKKLIMQGELSASDKQGIAEWLDSQRSEYPVVFNIESTNACNMACPFCPRTTLMTRKVKIMDPALFMKVALQLHPHPQSLWLSWCDFAEKEYGVKQNEQSENAFFLYILPRVMVLHGYGDPLLDPHIPDYVGILNRAGIPSYFSCNPANIRMDRLERCFENGLDYVKFSVDTLGAGVRGQDDFERDYPHIMQALNLIWQHGYRTRVVITMIDLGQAEFENLRRAFAGTDVYIYQKSLDQAWLTGKDAPQSIHWKEPCQIPWSSMTINSSGLAVGCEEDYNGEIVLGDAKCQTLEEIWNGEKYAAFRRAHFDCLPARCAERCDMRVIGKFLKG